MKTKKSNEGITLIALVITIIVLLILAGVSLSLITGSDGILGRSEKAVDQTNISSGKEQAELLIADYLSEYYEEAYVNANQSVASKTVEAYIQGQITEAGTETSSGDYFVTISSDNKITVYKGTSADENNKVAEGTLLAGGKVEWKNVDIGSSEIDSDVFEFTGKNFNIAIKQLANGDGTYDKWGYVDGVYTSVQSPLDEEFSDSIITGIELTNIYPADNVESKKLTNTSKNEDIVVYLDGTVVKIYSETDYISLPSDCSNMFKRLQGLQTLDVSTFDASNVTNMSRMFENSVNLTTLNLGGKFDTSNVTDMSYMFYNSYGFEEINFGDNLDTSKVTNMSYMFAQLYDTVSLDLGSKFDTSNVTDMSYMFRCCGANTSLALNLREKFDTSNVKNMSHMFEQCGRATTLNLGENFDTSKVTNMSYMFAYLYELVSLDLGSKFDTSNVTDMSYMFRELYALESLDLGGKFDTSKVTNMDYMFDSCGPNAMTTLDLGSKFNISNVTSYNSMLSFCGISDIVIYAPQSVVDWATEKSLDRTLTAKTY